MFVKYMDHFHVQSRKFYTWQEKIYTGTACGACDKYEVWVMVSVNLKYHVVPPDDWLVVLHGGGFAACGGHIGGGGV